MSSYAAAEQGLVRAHRAHPEAGLDLVGILDLLPGEAARRRAQPDDLVAEPALGQVVQEPVGVVDEGGRVGLRGGLDCLRDAGRPEVRVEQALVEPREAQPQLDVALPVRVAHSRPD
jgi:hypothetical protein